jgi:signal transduction histidine kinase
LVADLRLVSLSTTEGVFDAAFDNPRDARLFARRFAGQPIMSPTPPRTDRNYSGRLLQFRSKLNAHTAGLSLSANVSENVPLVRGDQRKITQVLLNLINNSIKFTPAAGLITISAQADALSGVTLTVSDTGSGIAADDLERVMRPFEQGASPLNRQHQGTGLGLPLVKEIVEQHGGRLELSSELNTGTTVSVILPPVRTVPRSQPINQRTIIS